MSPMDYCLLVQRAVRNSRPASCEQSDFNDWFGDTGRAATSLSYAIEGKQSKALTIAERLAEKYSDEFSRLT